MFSCPNIFTQVGKHFAEPTMLHDGPTQQHIWSQVGAQTSSIHWQTHKCSAKPFGVLMRALQGISVYVTQCNLKLPELSPPARRTQRQWQWMEPL